MKTVENPCVATIALTRPTLVDSRGLEIAASAIVRFDSESRGPLNVSGVPNLRKSHVGIRGMMNPAPSPMRLFIPENLIRVGKFLPLISFVGLGVSLYALRDRNSETGLIAE